MKEHFATYLKAIGMSDTLLGRVQTIYDFFKEICPEDISSIFVDDIIKEDGTREYETLYLFARRFLMEAKHFITQDQFEMALLDQQVFHWSVEKQDYDFRNATEKSRLHITIYLGTRIQADFKGAKNNCDFLKEIFRAHFVTSFPK
jgi:hypothetical protein